MAQLVGLGFDLERIITTLPPELLAFVFDAPTEWSSSIPVKSVGHSDLSAAANYAAAAATAHEKKPSSSSLHAFAKQDTQQQQQQQHDNVFADGARLCALLTCVSKKFKQAAQKAAPYVQTAHMGFHKNEDGHTDVKTHLKTLLKRYTGIKHIMLRGQLANSIDDEALLELTTLAPKLRSLQCCYRNRNEEGAVDSAAEGYATRLALRSRAPHVSQEGIERFAAKCRHVEKLALAVYREAESGGSCFASVVRKLPRLRELDLTGECGTEVRDDQSSAPQPPPSDVVVYAVNLTRLNLFLSKIDVCGARAMHSLTKLKCLVVGGLKAGAATKGTACLQTDALDELCRGHFAHLESLSVVETGCLRETWSLVTPFVKERDTPAVTSFDAITASSFPALTALNISRSDGVPDASLANLVRRVGGSLTTLNMRGPSCSGADTLSAIEATCKRLKFLNMLFHDDSDNLAERAARLAATLSPTLQQMYYGQRALSMTAGGGCLKDGVFYQRRGGSDVRAIGKVFNRGVLEDAYHDRRRELLMIP